MQNFDWKTLLLKEAISEVSVTEHREIRAFLRSELSNRRRGLHFYGFEAFDKEGAFTEAFVEIFDLSDPELQDLTEISKYVWDEYFRLSKSNSRVTKIGDDIRVEIDAFDGADELYSGLLDAFKKVLDEDRYFDLMAFSEIELKERFYQYGGKKLEVVVTSRIETQGNPDRRLIRVRKYEVHETITGEGGKTYKGGSILGESGFAERYEIIKRLIEDAQLEIPITEIDQQSH